MELAGKFLLMALLFIALPFLVGSLEIAAKTEYKELHPLLGWLCTFSLLFLFASGVSAIWL